MPDKLFYRFRDLNYEDGVRVVREELILVKETPCGYWIDDPKWYYSIIREMKWVSKTARKRFAYPSEEQAIESFVARKRQQIRYTKARLRRAEQAYQLGMDLMAEIKGK